MTNDKTNRSITLANGKTANRKFPAGATAFIVLSDSDWAGANVYWTGNRAAAQKKLEYMVNRLHNGKCHHAGRYPNARIVEVPCPGM